MSSSGVPQTIPAPIAPSQLEALRGDATLFGVINSIVQRYNAFLANQTEINNLAAPPTGPRSVTVSQLGGTVQVNFGSDLGASPIDTYVIYRADGGTRSAPTTPTPASAQIVATVPAQSAACLIGTGFAAGTYTWIDRNYTITQLDPANPARFSYWVASVDNQGRISIPIAASGSPIEAVANGPGDQGGSDPTKTSPLNKLSNSALLLVSGTLGGAKVPISNAITAATNATPIQITTGSAHGYATNDTVWIGGNTINTAANGFWTITKVDNFNFTLNTSVGNGLNGGGNVVAVKSGPTNQPVPPTDSSGAFSWSPWWTNDTVTTTFTDDGTNFTQELTLNGGAFITGQYFYPFVFRPGMHVTFSVYLRSPGGGSSNVQVQFIDSNNSSATFNISNTLLATTYKRFVFNWVIGTAAQTTALTSRLTIQNSTSVNVFMTRPMFNLGDAASAWNPILDTVRAPQSLSSGADATVQSWARNQTTLYFRDSSAVYA